MLMPCVCCSALRARGEAELLRWLGNQQLHALVYFPHVSVVYALIGLFFSVISKYVI